MGWLGNRRTVEEAVREELETTENAGRRTVAEKSVLRREYLSTGPGYVLYALMRTTKADGSVIRWAMVSLIEKMGPMVYVKRMDETVGPCYYGFPVEWLSELSEPVAFAEGWRKKVRENAESANYELRPVLTTPTL